VGAARFNARIDALLFRVENEGMGRFTMQFRDNQMWPSTEQSMERSVGAISDLDEIASSTQHRCCASTTHRVSSMIARS
jgi:hypothetical protein